MWSLLQGSAKKQPEDCPLSPPPPAFWGQEPHGAFLAAPTACLGEGSLSGKCVFLRWMMESNPTSPLGISYPILCAFFCLAVDIFPDMGSWGSKEGFPQLRAAFSWLWTRAACSKPWAAWLLCVPKHRVTSGYTKCGNSWAETLPLSTSLEARG